MKSLTILREGATILHDGLVALSPEGNPVFILPANLATPQLDIHPEGMVVYSVPEQQFPRFAELLLNKEKLTFHVRAAGPERGVRPSAIQPHALDLTMHNSDEEMTA